MNISDAIEKIIANDIASNMDLRSLTHDDNLLEKSIIDSLGLMKLIDNLEKNFSIEIPDEEIVPENFETINCMVNLVGRHIDQS